MKSSVWAYWAAQGSKEEEENKFEYFLATFEGVFFQLFNVIFKYSSIRCSVAIR